MLRHLRERVPPASGFVLWTDNNAVLINPRTASASATIAVESAAQLGLQARIFNASHSREINDAFTTIARDGHEAVLPEIPILGDFVPGYEASGWLGFGVPKDTPAAIIGISIVK